MPIKRRKSYPDQPGYERESVTSKAAARSVTDIQGTLQERAFAYILDAGDRGLTCDELEQLTEWRHQTASARIRELVLKNWIVDSGRQRQTSSGRKASVWVSANPLRG